MIEQVLKYSGNVYWALKAYNGYIKYVNKSKNSIWVSPWIQDRDNTGAHTPQASFTLLDDLYQTDPKRLKNIGAIVVIELLLS